MRGLRAILILMAALLFVVFVGGQALIPPFIETQVASGIRAELPDVDHVAVRLSGFPAYRMLAGNFRRVAVDIDGLRVDGLQVRQMRLRGEHAQFRLSGLLRRRLILESAERMTTELQIDAADLADFLQARAGSVFDVRVKLEQPRRATVVAAVSVLGQTLELAISGRFETSGGETIRFRPDAIVLLDEEVPAALVEAIAAAWDLSIDASLLPIPHRIETVRVQQESLIIEGTWLSEGEATISDPS